MEKALGLLHLESTVDADESDGENDGREEEDDGHFGQDE
jgi:hypothetical protein